MNLTPLGSNILNVLSAAPDKRFHASDLVDVFNSVEPERAYSVVSVYAALKVLHNKKLVKPVTPERYISTRSKAWVITQEGEQVLQDKEDYLYQLIKAARQFQ